MTQFLFANPGQTVTIAIQTLDSEGVRADSPAAPVIDTFFNPALTQEAGFPKSMVKLSTGLWQSPIVLAATADLGTYIASISWTHPDTAKTQYEVVNIHVLRTFGVPIVVSG